MDLLVVDLDLTLHKTFVDFGIGETCHLTVVGANFHEHGALEFADFELQF